MKVDEYSTPVKKLKPLQNAFSYYCKATRKKLSDGTEARERHSFDLLLFRKQAI